MSDVRTAEWMGSWAPLRVYVAGNSSERGERAKPVIEKLRNAGCVITYDWTVAVDEFGANAVGETQARLSASRDLAGVRGADVVLALAPETGGCGMWIEVGAAFALGIPVLFSCPEPNRTIFSRLALARFESDHFAVAYLLEMHRQGRPSRTSQTGSEDGT